MGAPERLGLAEAVAAHVADGAAVHIGNFGAQLFAVGHELIRQGRTDLHAIISSGGILLDQLIGAGVLRAATFSHCWSPVGPAPASCFRRLAESGDPRVALTELSLGTLTAGLTAGAWDVPFMPARDLPGTGYAEEGWTAGATAVVTSPFGRATVVRAIVPDVAFVHVDAVTPRGDGLLRTPRGEAVAAAQAAGRLVLVAEELVGDDAALADPAAVAIPGLLVDAVVVAPGALHPDGAAGRYDRDVGFYEAYAAEARTAEGFTRWLDRWVRDVPDHEAYRALVGEVGG
jgi:glutaconate CoA-transferase, subunit A